MAAAELDDQCPSVSLDSSCDSSSFDGDDCATTAQKVTDLVLPHILGVNPFNYQPLQVYRCSVRHPNWGHGGTD